MAKFNPNMLDASVRDVVSRLSFEHKTDVLLFALERIVSRPEARTTVENAAASVLQMSADRPAAAVQARLLRAKARLASGDRGAANKDLQDILQLDPLHSEAKALMPGSRPPDRAALSLHFMNEIWAEIAAYLPRRDLRALLRVPHPLGAIARALLLRHISLHLGPNDVGGWGEHSGDDDDAWHARRAAEILAHFAAHPPAAAAVRSLNIIAGGAGEHSFQLAMVESVLPRLVNLTGFGCRTNGPAAHALVLVLAKHGAKLTSLVLDPTTPLPADIPDFPLLTHFAYGASAADSSADIRALAPVLRPRSVALRALVVHVPIGNRALPLAHLVALDVRLDGASTSFDAIFAGARYLERLVLAVRLGGPGGPGVHQADTGKGLARAFRTHAHALPVLRSFALALELAPGGAPPAADVVPAVTEFVRAHADLRVLRISCGTAAVTGQLPHGVAGQHAAVQHVHAPSASVIWSVLPGLGSLKSLALDLPRDPALAIWLIPKSVIVLHLGFVEEEGASMLAQLLPGLPRTLRVLSLPPLSVGTTLRDMLHTTLPDLALLVLNGTVHDVVHPPHTQDHAQEHPHAPGSGAHMPTSGVTLTRWSGRRARFGRLDALEGEDAPWAPGLPWRW